MRMYIFIYVYVHIYMYEYIDIYVCMFVRVYVCLTIHVNIGAIHYTHRVYWHGTHVAPVRVCIHVYMKRSNIHILERFMTRIE